MIRKKVGFWIMILGIVLSIGSYLLFKFGGPSWVFIHLLAFLIGIPLIILGNNLRRLGGKKHRFLYWAGWITIFIFVAILCMVLYTWYYWVNFR